MLRVAHRTYFKLIHFTLLLTLISISSLAQALEATVEANGFSFSFGPAATNDGLTIFFTTFDGSSGVPLQDCVGNFCTISQELEPSSLGSTNYRADYIVQDSGGVFEEFSINYDLGVTLSLTDCGNWRHPIINHRFRSN